MPTNTYRCDDGKYVVIGGNAGIFGFDLDGSELADGDLDPSTNGRLADPLGEGPVDLAGEGLRVEDLAHNR